MGKHISSEVSKATLDFERGDQPASFTVTVYNDSYKTQDVNKFASFQLNLLAAGKELTHAAEWYRLSPAVSYKIPPGDRTQFKVEILDVPPISPDFTGTLNLTTRVYSPELRDEDRKDIRMTIKGGSISPPKVHIISSDFTALPGEDVEIKVRLYNPNRKSIDCGIRLNGLAPNWLPEGQQKTLLLQPKTEGNLVFLCRIPEPAAATSQLYPLTFELLRPVTIEIAGQATLRVLPAGTVQFGSDIDELWLPEKPNDAPDENPNEDPTKELTKELNEDPNENYNKKPKLNRWLNPRYCEAIFPLFFDNQSNLTVSSGVTVIPPTPRFSPFQRWRRSSASSIATLIRLQPEQQLLSPGQSAPIDLHITQRMPWLGWSRLRTFKLQPFLADITAETSADIPALNTSTALPEILPVEKTFEKTIALQNLSPSVMLRAAPVIPGWLQLLGLLVGSLSLGAIIWSMFYRGHTAPINAVQINGQGNEAISASEDQSLRRWRIKGKRLVFDNVIIKSDKAIRAAQYRPVSNNEVAAAFENGMVEMTNAFSDEPSAFIEDTADRALDVAFSRDARKLFSAHGSGAIRQWSVDPSERVASQREPTQKIQVDFAAYAIALLGNDDSLLAIAGEQNQLAIANLQAGTIERLPYATRGGKTDIILDIATTEAYPTRLATADNQGRIALWDTTLCNATSCDPITEWIGHGGKAVRSIALTQDGCYLASGGDDGQVMLWPLTWQSFRPNGQRIRHAAQSINAVDITQHRSQLRIASGGDDHQIKLDIRRISDPNTLGTCPTP